MSRNAGRWGQVLTAMVTPMHEDGSIDYDGVGALARYLQDNGNDALVVTGTTGESPALTDDERIETWRAAVEAVTIPIIAGSGTNDTAHSIEMTQAAKTVGAAGILVVTPYYNRPSQAGLYGHFRAVADCTDLPVMLYDIPIRSGRKIAHETFLNLIADCPNIVANKDAAKDPSATALLLRDAPDYFETYSGDSSYTLPFLAVGACGIVGVASHWTGAAQKAMIDSFFQGDVDRSRERNAALLSSYEFEGGDAYPNPLPAKAVMRQLGLPVGQCRLPMGPAPSELDEAAKALLASIGPLAAPHL
ncbi:MAG TPA: 4-hydroxy-tetrahydrodipicolinate synthase [Acidimicrobiales bacterium]|nr:4-hydroxy-tetrahydrodipicolinate synthase [Acidimicrobiales bacterium]